MNQQTENQLNKILDGYYCSQYEQQFLGENDKLLYGWKANHDEMPRLIGDNQLLKIRIVDVATKFDLTGDIELDQGFSFSYQVTVFFASYFLKQVIRSQFSIYDAFATGTQNVTEETDETQSMDQQQRSHADANIFRDMNSVKGHCPSDKALQSEVNEKGIKIIRLKSSRHWIHYVCLTPTEADWHQKQQAILNCDIPVDSLLKAAFDFLDVNDLATVNRVNEDNSHRHRETVGKLMRRNPHDQATKIVVPTSDGDKQLIVDMMSQNQSLNQAAQIENHLIGACKTGQPEPAIPSNIVHQTGLLALPSHLLVTYSTLRYMESRDAKTKLLYTLNYFRSIQKRLALDLREFGTRDRIDGSADIVQSEEANQTILSQLNLSTQVRQKEPEKQDDDDEKQKMTVFDMKAIAEMNNVATIRQYKHNGHWNNKVFQTCPSYPKLHAAYGQPTTSESLAEEMDSAAMKQGITEHSVKLMGRIDSIEIDEVTEEVYVKDDFGIYILHDCVLQDMKSLEDQLYSIGTYYLNSSEVLLDPKGRPSPWRDRGEVAKDLLLKEAKFNFEKVKLVQVYMECYEHISDPLEQQRLMQIVTDIMARRPRLNLQANYFVDAYDAEIKCIQKQFELVKMLVDLQITLEKTESQRLQDALNLSYSLANQYATDKWKYQDAAALLQALEQSKQQRQQADQFAQKMEQEQDHPKSEVSPKPQSSSQSEGSSDSEESDYFKNDENQFTQLLGLPKITIESIYQAYREQDSNVLMLMREHSNFIAIYEGYPEFLTLLTHHSILDKNRVFKLNSWSQPSGALDFYDSLDFINKFYAITLSTQQELYDSLKMWDPSLMTLIDTQVAIRAMDELRKVISFQDGSLVEYKGRELVEDESIMGNADKLIFFAKELIGDLTIKPKHVLDPFIIAKLDVQSIQHFKFPQIPKTLNKYSMRKQGIAGIAYIRAQDEASLTGIAKDKIDSQEEVNQGGGKMTDVLNRRQLQVPSQLQAYCNMCELLRLRQEIIIAASECSMLAQVYKGQCEQIGQLDSRVQLSEGINFQSGDYEDEQFVNFFEDGPSHLDTIELAVNEFDPKLLSNFNFRNPDSFKINIFTAGLEEVRAILHYQLLQKHILIVATRTNSLLTEAYVRAQSEINLFVNVKFAVPNSVIDYTQLIHNNSLPINPQAIKLMRQQYKQSVGTQCYPLFLNVVSKKSSQRSNISKEFSNYQVLVQQAMPLHPHCISRVMRCFKVKLLTKFVQNLQSEVYLNAHKIQALHSCQRLRVYNRYFAYDAKILGEGLFKYETSMLLENIPFNFVPEHLKQRKDQYGIKQSEGVKIISNSQIVDHFGLPSSATLLMMDAAPIEDQQSLKAKARDRKANYWSIVDSEELKEQSPEIIEPENHLKRMLPTFTPDDNSDLLCSKRPKEEIDAIIAQRIGKSAGGLLDYQEALYFGDCEFASMCRYYVTLERILMIEWFIKQLEFRSDDVITFDQAVECGLPYFTEDSQDTRIKSLLKPVQPTVSKTEQILSYQAKQLRQKLNIAEAVQSVCILVKNFISTYTKTKTEERVAYLNEYTDFRYQQVVGCLHKLTQGFYLQGKIPAAKSVQLAIAQLTKMDHIRLICLKPHNFSVRDCVVAPHLQCLESGSLTTGSMNREDSINFLRCVEPVQNQKKLEPSQITLFQSLYQQDPMRQSTPAQFAGQFVSTNNVPFKTLQSALINLSLQERNYSQQFIASAKYQANDFMETLYNDSSMRSFLREDVYNLSQLVQARKFINESTTALLLRNALICWVENSTLPNDAKKYQEYEVNFRQNFLWKQLQQKEQIAQKIQSQQIFGVIPKNEDLEVMKQKIDNLVNDQNISTVDELKKRDDLVKALREEFSGLKKKVILDRYFNTKAEVLVFSNEIEKLLIMASVKTLDSESTALAKCFATQVPSVQYHIHPFQQFAATFFDKVDPNYNLDVSNKVNSIQELLTKMRNRATEVETLTSGPAIVLTIKDINEIMLDFCRTTISENQQQFKSRGELWSIVEGHLRSQIYLKDQKIGNLQKRVSNMSLNLDNIVNARIFEKGNQLVYELDQSKRVLSLFKGTVNKLEEQVTVRILGEQLNKFKRKNNQVEMKDQKFNDYKQHIIHMIDADFTAEQDRIKTILKDKAEIAKISDKDYQSGKRPMMYSGQSEQSALIPNPKYPWPTMELAELDQVSEQEARCEVERMCRLLRQQRLLYRTKEMKMMTKYQSQITSLQSEQHSNSQLWDQLAESEKREKVLKQELLFTQQTLSNAHKQIDNLHSDIKVIQAEKQTLLKYKKTQLDDSLNQKSDSKTDLISTDKLIRELTKKDNEFIQVKQQLECSELQLKNGLKRRDEEQFKYKKLFLKEQAKSQGLIDKMQNMKVELQMLEQSDTTVTGIWKRKCFELFGLSEQVKRENDSLRGQCLDLINQGLKMADQLPPIVNHKSSELKVNHFDQHVYTSAQVLNQDLLLKSPVRALSQLTYHSTGGMKQQLKQQCGYVKAADLSYVLSSSNEQIYVKHRQQQTAIKRRQQLQPIHKDPYQSASQTQLQSQSEFRLSQSSPHHSTKLNQLQSPIIHLKGVAFSQSQLQL